jgi:colanic acid biosynthesis glycosyl transferase WcaI
MNIILLSCSFKPEPVVCAQIARSLASELTSGGHTVKVITSFPSRPGGKLYPGCTMRLYQKEQDPCGFEIVRCFSVPSPKSTLLSRFVENITFGLSAALYIVFLPKIDAIYTDTWPIVASGLISLVARIKKIAYILRITDLYPESIVSQKRLKAGHFLYRVMHRIDRWIAEGAFHVAVLTEYFSRVYIHDRKIPANKVSVIPDWADGEIDCCECEKSALVRKQFSIQEDSFLIAYGGNIGVAAGVDTLIKASALLPGIQVLIAGDGSELQACQTLAGDIAPDRVSFFSPWPKDQTMALYQAADVLVLPTYGDQSIASIPSKLIGYMLSGRSVIAAGLPGTELIKVVEKSQCGWVIPPDDPAALAEAILLAKNSSQDERRHRGMTGREYALKNFTAAANLPRMVSVIEQISSKDRQGKTVLTGQF